MNEDQLIHDISDYADRTAIIWRNHLLSYKKLEELIDRWTQFFVKNNILPCECIAFSGDYSPQLISLLFALVKNKNIIVPLTKINKHDKTRYLEIACASKIIEFKSANSWKLRTLSTAKNHKLFQSLQEKLKAGLILFSSGSSGQPKAMLLNFIDTFKKYIEDGKSYKTIAFLLFDHIGGLNTLIYTLSHGGTLIIPRDRNAITICRLIQKYQAELLPSTPTFLNMLLLSHAHENYDLSSLKIITYGTEPMLPTTLNALHKFFPHVKLKQTYGMTELGILPTVSENDSSLLIKVGGKGYESKIQDGTLWIKTDSKMIGYLNVPNDFDKSGWIDTGDVVEVHGDYLRILGRKSEIINVGGEKVFPAEVEDTIIQAPNIKSVVVVSKPNPIVGHVVVAMVELNKPEDAVGLNKRMRTFCQSRLLPFKIPVIFTVSQKELHNARFKKKRANL